VVVGLVRETVSDQVDGHAVEVFGQHPEVRGEGLPVPARAMQQHRVRLVGRSRLRVPGAHGGAVHLEVDEALPELDFLEVHPDTSVVLGVDARPGRILGHLAPLNRSVLTTMSTNVYCNSGSADALLVCMLPSK